MASIPAQQNVIRKDSEAPCVRSSRKERMTQGFIFSQAALQAQRLQTPKHASSSQELGNMVPVSLSSRTPRE